MRTESFGRTGLKGMWEAASSLSFLLDLLPQVTGFGVADPSFILMSKSRTSSLILIKKRCINDLFSLRMLTPVSFCFYGICFLILLV